MIAPVPTRAKPPESHFVKDSWPAALCRSSPRSIADSPTDSIRGGSADDSRYARDAARLLSLDLPDLRLDGFDSDDECISPEPEPFSPTEFALTRAAESRRPPVSFFTHAEFQTPVSQIFQYDEREPLQPAAVARVALTPDLTATLTKLVDGVDPLDAAGNLKKLTALIFAVNEITDQQYRLPLLNLIRTFAQRRCSEAGVFALYGRSILRDVADAHRDTPASVSLEITIQEIFAVFEENRVDLGCEVTPPLPAGAVRYGRSEKSDIVVMDASISLRHCDLLPGGMLRDLATNAGTYVNGVRLHKPTRLRQGDIIRMGETMWRYAGGTLHNCDLKPDDRLPMEAPLQRVPTLTQSMAARMKRLAKRARLEADALKKSLQNSEYLADA